jgi:hypothetical protein
VFSHDAIEAAFDGSVEPLFGTPEPREPADTALDEEVRPLFGREGDDG